jgi:hypothetical protein
MQSSPARSPSAPLLPPPLHPSPDLHHPHSLTVSLSSRPSSVVFPSHLYPSAQSSLSSAYHLTALARLTVAAFRSEARLFGAGSCLGVFFSPRRLALTTRYETRPSALSPTVALSCRSVIHFSLTVCFQLGRSLPSPIVSASCPRPCSVHCDPLAYFQVLASLNTTLTSIVYHCCMSDGEPPATIADCGHAAASWRSAHCSSSSEWSPPDAEPTKATIPLLAANDRKHLESIRYAQLEIHALLSSCECPNTNTA